MIKVAKFGGSSLADAGQFRKVKDIVNAEEARKFIVASACGKRNKDDHKITDLLYLCEAHLKYGVSYDDIFSMIEDRYLEIKKELGLSIDIESEFEKIRGLVSKSVPVDYLVSRGEYITSRCLAEYLDADFVDASDVIAFDYDGQVNLKRSAELLEPYCSGRRKVVIPGFYGCMPNGAIRLMPRGGSDITGAVVANIVGADIYENWTDVSGIMVTDPKIVRNPLHIKRINYAELREMSYMGANVLNDEAIFPVKQKNIPINIRNTNQPDDPGTMIMEDCSELDAVDPPHYITGITRKVGYTAMTVLKSHSSSDIGFMRKALQIFEEYGLSIESIPVGVDSFSLIVSTEAVEPYLFEIIGKLRKDLGADDVTVMDGLAMLAIVGRGMKAKIGISGQIFSELGKNGINIKTISQGSDEISIIVGVEAESCDDAIRAIYNKFVGKGAEK
ncbi:MAG: aspartate kinase [Oscillospiraceae bacterium]|jgi:aspartate kinase